MSKPKKLDLGKLLAAEPKAKKRNLNPTHCEDCKAALVIRRGYGYCEACLLTVPLAVGVILNTGPHRGKKVYLKEAIVRELREDHDLSEMDYELKYELKTKDYFIIDEIEQED